MKNGRSQDEMKRVGFVFFTSHALKRPNMFFLHFSDDLIHRKQYQNMSHGTELNMLGIVKLIERSEQIDLAVRAHSLQPQRFE